MKVNDPKLANLTSTQVGSTDRVDSAAERQKRVESGAGSGDQVSLSSLTAKLRELDVDSPERAARLERLGADVASGRYQVDSAELSREIVSDSINDIV
jgi:flagellar biosynthesis anti-sigma factor FlgM